MSGQRHMVRMAEQVVSSNAEDMLVSLGLGSCIGLTLLDESAKVAGLSHIVLPAAPATPGTAPAAKFANTAVPALIDAVVKAGATKTRLRAVLCGGAHMFGNKGGSTSPIMQIGDRNAAETLAALTALHIPIRAQDTGGSSGRSIEVKVGTGEVFVRGVGQAPKSL